MCTARCEGAELVVNLVGILAERRAGDFQRIHAEGAGRDRAAGGGGRRAAAGACLGDRRRPGQPEPLRQQQGGGRAGGAGGVSRRRRSCGPRSCSGRRTSSSTASPPWRRCLPVMPVICRATPVPAGLCRRRGGCGDGRRWRGADARRRAVRAGRPARLDLPRDAGLDPCSRRGATGRWSTVPMGLARLQASAAGAAAGQAADPRSASDAAAGQRGGAPACRGWRSWGSCRRRWSWWCRPISRGSGRAGGDAMLPPEAKIGPQSGPISSTVCADILISERVIGDRGFRTVIAVLTA